MTLHVIHDIMPRHHLCEGGRVEEETYHRKRTYFAAALLAFLSFSPPLPLLSVPFSLYFCRRERVRADALFVYFDTTPSRTPFEPTSKHGPPRRCCRQGSREAEWILPHVSQMVDVNGTYFETTIDNSTTKHGTLVNFEAHRLNAI